MTAIIVDGACTGYTRYKITDTWNLPHGTFHRLQIGTQRQISGVQSIIYRREQLRLYAPTECRNRKHKSFERNTGVRARVQ